MTSATVPVRRQQDARNLLSEKAAATCYQYPHVGKLKSLR
jgi:hypothetical protein